MVSVIGNKGNGKSAIAEIIGWLSDSKNYTKFAFLNSKKFLKNRLANNFTAKITWIDNQVSMKENLGAQPDLNNVERVQCIPQQYFEEICTDTELEKFTTEINGVIFSRLSEEDKEGARSFEELIDKYTRISEQNISLMQTNLSEVNRDIISLESNLSREYKTKQEALLQDAQNQLLAQINICPQEVKKPELPQEVQEQYDKVIEEIGNIENEIEKKQEEILEVNSVSKKVQHILEYIDEVENRINKEIEQITLQVEDFDIKVEEVIKFTVDKSPIISKKEIIDKKLSELKETVEDEQNGLKVQLKQKISVKESIVAEENRNIQLYDAYIKEYQEWEKVKKEKEEAVNKINEELLYISDGIMIDLQPLYEKRQNITASIFNEKKKVIELYNKFKKPVDEFLRDKADLLSEYSISIRSGLVINEMFQEEAFSYINKQKKNAFRDDNYQLTKTVDALAEMDDIEQYIAIPNKIIKKMKDYDNENIVSSQLKDNKWLEFYNYLFGLQYIQNKYELVSDNKTLEKLSPGERGALLLIFYLLLDLRDIPLVIDQPEDNLDNQSVASILVPFIQAAKKRRQIILVTHNPNLAVVADSDQIVHVKINKEERNLVEVKSGGIENTEINDSIVTILEGTMLSFRKRDEKGNTRFLSIRFRPQYQYLDQNKEAEERIYEGETPGVSYGDIAERYYTVGQYMKEVKDVSKAMAAAGDSYICDEYLNAMGSPEAESVYVLHDLNNDGIEEFFIGLKFNYDIPYYIIYDVYTWKDGRAYQLMRGIGYRNGSCKICENGVIEDNYSGSAWDGQTLYHILPEGGIELETIDSVSSRRDGTVQSYYHWNELIDENSLQTILEQYQPESVTYVDCNRETIEQLRLSGIRK